MARLPALLASLLAIWTTGASAADPFDDYRSAAAAYYAPRQDQDPNTEQQLMRQYDDAFEKLWTAARRCDDISMTSRFMALRPTAVDHSETLGQFLTSLALFNPRCFLSAATLLARDDWNYVRPIAFSIPAALTEVLRFERDPAFATFFAAYGKSLRAP